MALTNEGLVTRRFEEIIADLVASEQTNIDPNIDTRDDEYLGQMNSILALIVSDLEQLAQGVIDNLDIDKAEGIWLDKLAAEKGLKRQAASKSASNYQHLIGTDGTVVPAGTLFRSTITSDDYIVVEETTIAAVTCQAITYSINNLQNSTTYTITVNDVFYSYDSDASATKLEILNGLKALIDADTTKTWAATVDSGLETITVTTSDTLDIDVSSSTYLTSSDVTVFTTIEASETGVKVGLANTITNIISVISGLDSTINTVDVVVGRDRETDEEFRIRTLEADQVKSVATIPAITSRLRNIQGVFSATVIENETDVTDGDGRPPHSYEAVIVGGEDEDIAQDMWASKPAGIQLYGSTTELITDSEGIERSIKFSRPTVVNLAFRVTYTQYTEETLPSNPATIIKQVMVDETEDLEIGEDVIPSRYFGPIYTAVEGIDSLVVEVQQITDPGDTPSGGSWQTTKLAIAATEYASTTTIDVEVVAA